MQITLDTLTFDVHEAGDPNGPPVLLLHGFPQTSHCWRLITPYLTEFRCLLPDQRGYSPGARPTDREAYRMPCMVSDALGILDELGIEQVHLIGHDFGAAVGWQLAARRPARVRSLTALSVPHPRALIDALQSDADQRSRSDYMRTFAEPGFDQVLLADDAALLRRFFSDAVDVEAVVAAAQEPGALAAWLAWYPGQRLEDLGDTPKVTVPTMHVWSDQDVALGRTATESSAAWVSGPYRLAVLEGVSHWIPEEAPDVVGPLLAEHLRGAEAHLPGAHQ